MSCTVTVVPTVNAGAKQAPTIDNITIAAADTEQSYTFPSATKEFIFMNEGSAIIKFAYLASGSGTNFIEVAPSTSYDETNIALASLTVYFQSPNAGVPIRILSWS